MSVRLDHVVVVVASLAEATREFRAAGFTVLGGGRHDLLPTENALVCFADNTYLELLATTDPSTRAALQELRASDRWEQHLRGVSAVARRFLPRLAGDDGVTDWVLRDAFLASSAAAMRRLGIVASGPVPMNRTRPDGETLAWELLLPASPVHPFRIADRTPRDRRVPQDPASTTHPNGARGIASVRVRAAGAAMAALALGDALGLQPALRAGVTVLDAGAWQVVIVEGEPEGACGAAIAGVLDLTPAIRGLGIQRSD